MQTNGVLIPPGGASYVPYGLTRQDMSLVSDVSSLVGKIPFTASIESVPIHIGTLTLLDNK